MVVKEEEEEDEEEEEEMIPSSRSIHASAKKTGSTEATTVLIISVFTMTLCFSKVASSPSAKANHLRDVAYQKH